MALTIFFLIFAEEVVPEFEVVIDQPSQVVQPGADARLDCSARGAVNVDRIEWSRERDHLPPGE